MGNLVDVGARESCWLTQGSSLASASVVDEEKCVWRESVLAGSPAYQQ